MRASIRDIDPAFGALWNIVGSCFDPAHAGAHRKWTLVDAVQPQWSRQLRGLEVPVTHLLELRMAQGANGGPFSEKPPTGGSGAGPPRLEPGCCQPAAPTIPPASPRV